MSKKKVYLISLTGLVLFTISALILYFKLFSKPDNRAQEPLNIVSNDNSAEVYTNKKGQTWTIEDKTDFTVSSAPGAKITFIEGKIDPLKVHPGDTQNMRIVVKADSGIKSVIANIETDNGINKIELKKTGVVSVKDLNPLAFTYPVDKNNQIQILSPQEAKAYRQREIAAESNSLINAAQAGTGEREVWEGSWLVKDTSVKEYNTTFVATDSQGNQDKLVLAWSDPCKDNTNVDWRPNAGNIATPGNGNGTCSISSVYGIDNGNLTVTTGDQINLNDKAVLVFNTGKSITIQPGGRIVINSSGGTKGMFTKGYLWALDADNDHYAANDSRLYNNSSTTPPQAGYKRQNTLMSNTLDCYDNNLDARPGQTNFFTVQRGDGSFDYDCDGTSKPQYAYYCDSPSYVTGYWYQDGTSGNPNGGSTLACKEEGDGTCEEFGGICNPGYCCLPGDHEIEYCVKGTTITSDLCGNNTKYLSDGLMYQIFSGPYCGPDTYKLYMRSLGKQFVSCH